MRVMCCFQVKEILLSEGAIILRLVAESGQIGVWESVAKVLRENISPEQVQSIPGQNYCSQRVVGLVVCDNSGR